jgi:hypothetical protein
MLKHSVITYFYQFSAEAIIAFLLILPFTFNYYEPNHYWGFIMIMFITAVLFFLLETLHSHTLFFLFTMPINTLLFSLSDFPIVLAILFPLIFVWRYANVRSFKKKEQEGLHLHVLDKRYERNKAVIYLQVTLILAVIGFIYTREIVVFIYLLLQFIILLAGYLVSHLVEIERKEHQRVDLKGFFLIPIFMLIGSLVISFIYNPFLAVINQVWVVIKTVIIFLISNVAIMIDYILPNKDKTPTSEESPEMMRDMRGNQLNYNDGLPGNQIIDEAILEIVATCIIFAIIILLIMRSFKKTREESVLTKQTVSHHSLDKKKNKKEGLLKRYVENLSRKPDDRVRSLVYNFERKAARNNSGRYSFESIEEWFRRLQVDVDVATYQKVRYGGLEARAQEMYELEQQLKEVEFILRKNK